MQSKKAFGYNFKIKKEAGGFFSASCVEIKGCQTQAASMKELKSNMKEVLNLSLSEVERWPKSQKTKAAWTAVPVDMVRVNRLIRGIPLEYNFDVAFNGIYFDAICIELKDCSTSADTVSELKSNVRKVLNARLEKTHKWPKPQMRSNQHWMPVAVDKELLKRFG